MGRLGFIQFFCLLCNIQYILCKASSCYSGWTDVNGLCHRIINRKSDSKGANCDGDGDLIMASEITDDLRDLIGYDEKVWMNKSGNIEACSLTNPLNCTTPGIYNSLCSMPMLNAVINLDEPKRFFEASWMIPNTNKSLQLIKEQYRYSSPQNGMWIGLYKTGDHLLWVDNSFVSENEKAFLNISDSLSDRECAMYNGSVILTDCSLRKMGLTIPLLNAPCCHCSPPRRRNIDELKKSLKAITVIKKDTSKYKRSKTSAPDERTSSKAIGMVAALVIGVPFALLIISDIPILVYQLIETFKNIRQRFQRTEG